MRCTQYTQIISFTSFIFFELSSSCFSQMSLAQVFIELWKWYWALTQEPKTLHLTTSFISISITSETCIYSIVQKSLITPHVFIFIFLWKQVIQNTTFKAKTTPLLFNTAWTGNFSANFSKQSPGTAQLASCRSFKALLWVWAAFWSVFY